MDKQLNNPLVLQEDSIVFGMNGAEHGKFKAGFLGVHNLLHVQDQKAAGVHGGTFTSGAWRTRDLNTVVLNNITGSSLSLNKITLPVGTYYVKASAPILAQYNYSMQHVARIQNITTALSLLYGQNHRQHQPNGSSSMQLASVEGVIILGTSGDIELQHIVETTMPDMGFGVANSLFGIATPYEIYSDLKIWKIA